MIDEKELVKACLDFRKDMLGRKKSKGYCAKISWALQGYLSFAYGLETEAYASVVKSVQHLWLLTRDGRVIDCTADQFNTWNKRYAKVHFGRWLDIHQGGVPYKHS